MTDQVTLTTAQATALRQPYRYCPQCGQPMTDQMVYGRLRRTCPDEACRFVQFIDPKVACGALIEQAGQVLLVKRNVEPARGSWCIPGGFMEQDETPQQGAIRECLEETGLTVAITHLIDVYYYSNYRGSGIFVIYKGHVVAGEAQPGDDADEVQFFSSTELPDNIVFESNLQALARWQQGEFNEE